MVTKPSKSVLSARKSAERDDSAALEAKIRQLQKENSRMKAELVELQERALIAEKQVAEFEKAHGFSAEVVKGLVDEYEAELKKRRG